MEDDPFLLGFGLFSGANSLLVSGRVIVDGGPFLRYMGVSKNRGTPKWMVYNGKPY